MVGVCLTNITDAQEKQVMEEQSYKQEQLKFVYEWWFAWPWPKGLTAPIWRNVVVVFYPMWRSPTRMSEIIRHETCHINQFKRWGFRQYWLKHIAARVRTLSLAAKEHPVERECDDVDRMPAVQLSLTGKQLQHAKPVIEEFQRQLDVNLGQQTTITITLLPDVDS